MSDDRKLMEAEREAFEAWAQSHQHLAGPFTQRLVDDSYGGMRGGCAWDAWQAATTAAQAQIASLEAAIGDLKAEAARIEYLTTGSYRAVRDERDEARARVAAIEAACTQVIANYDQSCREKYDEERWEAFAGVDPLRAAIDAARTTPPQKPAGEA